MKIGFMGAEGSFSEQASQLYVTTGAIQSYELTPLITADGVLGALSDGVIDRGVFPVMNSTGGIVIEAMYAMGKYTFSIETMFDMDIHHMLLTKGDVEKSTITEITSHDQAIKQCAEYIEREWSGVEIVRYRDTAQAAADLASGVLPPTTAVIAPRRCAELYNLHIAGRGIQDLAHNRTTFVVATRRMDDAE
jgi:prephenate dehydratase